MSKSKFMRVITSPITWIIGGMVANIGAIVCGVFKK